MTFNSPSKMWVRVRALSEGIALEEWRRNAFPPTAVPLLVTVGVLVLSLALSIWLYHRMRIKAVKEAYL
jgi:hypothetical protein